MKLPLRPALFALLLAAAWPALAQVLQIARPAVGLSVSDRTATRQGPVEFTVTKPDGRTSRAVAQPVQGGERAGTVHYPSDFSDAGTRPGEYTWTARVGGKVVATGRFAFRPAQDGQLLFVPG